jgi:hypothetical protein
MTFNFTGKVNPGLVIEAEIKRKKVIETVSFQVIDRREIRYEHREIWNVWTPEEVWEHFFTNDSRISPFECYDVSDQRPWHPHMLVSFILRNSDVVDTTENQGGSAGGGNGNGRTCPPVGRGPKGREQGKALIALSSRTGPIDEDRVSSETDSEEDEEGSDFHELSQIRHAIDHLKQQVTVILKARYEWQNEWEEVTYQRNMLERIAREDMMEPLVNIYGRIGEVAVMAGAPALPPPIQGFGVTSEQLHVEILKKGKGLQLVYERPDQKGLPDRNYDLKFTAQFPEGISVVFGTGKPASNAEISERLRSITGSWFSDQYGPSW